MNLESPGADLVFGEALHYELPSERELYLRKACAGNAALRAEVDSLLAAHTQAGNFLNPPRATTTRAESLEGPGTTIGRP